MNERKALTPSGRPRIRARREDGTVAPVLSRDPAYIGSILERLAAGDSVRAVADDIGVSHQAVRALMLDEVPAEYREAQRRGLINQVAWATTLLEQADDPIAITRARELCRFTRWDAERRLPHLFGQQSRLTVETGPDLGELLREARRRVIQGTATVVE
jgi:hypothetical protein